MHGYTEGITRRDGFLILNVILLAILIELIFLFVQLNPSINDSELRINGSLDGCLF